jgi:hypothetical protein
VHGASTHPCANARRLASEEEQAQLRLVLQQLEQKVTSSAAENATARTRARPHPPRPPSASDAPPRPRRVPKHWRPNWPTWVRMPHLAPGTEPSGRHEARPRQAGAKPK